MKKALGDLPKGFALAYFLLIGTVIIMLTGAVLTLGSSSLQTTRGGVDDTRALYAAEAGLTRAIAQLERDSSWTGSYVEEHLPGKTAFYSMKFSSNPTSATSDQSVNNLTSDTPTDSYRGPNTVPPRSALLVVSGRSGLAKRTIEALIVSGVSIPRGHPLIVEGRIELQGSVHVAGQTSLSNFTPVVASLHSNANSEDNSVVISYSPDSSLPNPDHNELTISGQLTSSDPRPHSQVFQIDAPLSDGKLKSNVPSQELPRPNIISMVNEIATESSTNTLTQTLTPQTLVLQDNNYHNGNFEVNGDLVLDDNASLYIDGDLTINGSIKGRGKIVVTGKTEFFGDADVSYAKNDYLALLSHGHVVVKGFEGQRYLEALANSDVALHRVPRVFPGETDPSLKVSSNFPSTIYSKRAIENLSTALATLRTEFIDPNGHLLEDSPDQFHRRISRLENSTNDNLTDAKIDILQSFISIQPAGAVRGWSDTEASKQWLASVGLPTDAASGRTHNNAGALKDYLLAQGGGSTSTSAFLAERFQLLEDLFRQQNINRDGSNLDNFTEFFLNEFDQWDGSQGGAFDCFQSLELGPNDDDVLGAAVTGFIGLIQGIMQFDYDRIGQANFKGMIYTNGAFVATDDLNLLGTVVVNKDPNLEPLKLNGKTYQPGDALLAGYTTLTYIEEIFSDGVANLEGSGALDIHRWIAR